MKALASRDIDEINLRLDQFAQAVEHMKEIALDAEKKVKKAHAAAAAGHADKLLNELLPSHPDTIVISETGSGEMLQELLNGLKKRQYPGAAFIIIDDDSTLLLGSYCGTIAQEKGLQAGKLLQSLAAMAGGKGGGRADQARGSAPDRTARQPLADAAAKAMVL